MYKINGQTSYEHINSRFIMTYKDIKMKTESIINIYNYYSAISHAVTLVLIILYVEIIWRSDRTETSTNLGLFLLRLVTGMIALLSGKSIFY